MRSAGGCCAYLAALVAGGLALAALLSYCARPEVAGAETSVLADPVKSFRPSRSRRNVLSPERRPILNEFSFPANLVQGMRFVLMCQVLAGEPPVRIRWLKDQLELPAEGSAQLELLAGDELGASLLFRRVQPEHSGNYTCLATNHHGTSSYSSTMTVKVPPKWKVEPQDQESTVGAQIVIDCQASGNPNPFIRWKFGQQQQVALIASDEPAQASAQPAPSFKLITSNHHVQTLENGSLSIRQATKEHEGSYLCEADNGVEPSLVRPVRLLVHQQAQIADELQLVGAPTGAGATASGAQGAIRTLRVAQNATVARLLCQPSGELPLTLDWLRDGQLIYTHSLQPPAAAAADQSSALGHAHALAPADGGAALARHRVQVRRSPSRPLGLESELAIGSPSRHDAALYSCAARNAFGRAERTARLLVQEPPDAPEMVDVARISSRSIGLRWLAPFDGHSPILKYVVEYRRQPDAWNESSASLGALAGRSEKMVPAKSLEPAAQQALGVQQPAPQQQQQVQHTVHDLEPLAHYTMRVLAVNAIGQSRPSVALSLRTEEEVPSVVPNLVEINVLSSRAIRLHWTITYAPERELIDGFFVGYRSLEAQSLDKGAAPAGQPANLAEQANQPTFTYKTIRLTNQPRPALKSQAPGLLLDAPLRDHQSALLSPVSSVTKTVAPSPFGAGLMGHAQSGAEQQPQVVVVSVFEYTIGGLERSAEYSLLIQCFNKKGAGPASDPVVFRTHAIDPPEKLVLVPDEVTESSMRLSWRPASSELEARAKQADESPEPPVDGYVLTFAHVSRQHPAAGSQAKGAAKPSGYLSELNGSLDPAARISHESAMVQPPGQNLDQWQAIQLAPQQRSHQLKGLECGASYALKIWAFNKIGRGEASELLTIRTRGRAPIAPDRKSFMSVNSTQVRLHLAAWQDGGCEIEKFVVQYRARGQQDWVLVSNNILREQLSVLIRDLAPATAYELKVRAHNHVGPTERGYGLITLDSAGKPVDPASVFAPAELDYFEPDSGAHREAWPGGAGEPGLRASAALLHQLLSSPLTLLLALSSFIVLLILLLFHRFNQTSSTSSTGTLNSSSTKSLRAGAANSDAGGLGGCGATMDAGDLPHGGGSLSDTPQRMGELLSHRALGYTGPAGVADSLAAECSPYVGSPAYGSAGAVNPSIYGQLGAHYGQRPAAECPGAEQQQQQCLMQMLMMNAGQPKECDAQYAQFGPQQSYVTAALTTLARGKPAKPPGHNPSHLPAHSGSLSYSGCGPGASLSSAASLSRMPQPPPAAERQYQANQFPEQNTDAYELRALIGPSSSGAASDFGSTSGRGTWTSPRPPDSSYGLGAEDSRRADETKQYQVPSKVSRLSRVVAGGGVSALATDAGAGNASKLSSGDNDLKTLICDLLLSRSSPASQMCQHQPS